MAGEFQNLDHPFLIQGRQVYLIPDELNATARHDDSVTLQAAYENIPPIWVRESEIAHARQLAAGGAAETPPSEMPGIDAALSEQAADHPKAKRALASLAKMRAKRKPQVVRGALYYGFWQTVIHNRGVDTTKPLTVFRFDEYSGLYIICRNGAPAESGIYAGAVIPGSDVSLQEAADLSLPVGQLTTWRLPAEQAKTAAERMKEKGRASNWRILRVGGVTLGSMAAAAALYLTMESIAQSNQTQLTSINGQINMIEMAMASTRRNKLNPDAYPDKDGLEALAAAKQLHYGTSGAEVDWSDYSKPERKDLTAVSSIPLKQLTFPHKRTPRADGRMDYIWPKLAEVAK